MKQWRRALVNQAASLREAIEVLDEAALRIALVVDEDGTLLGTLTDGDVRRALLRHLPLETPVDEVMNANPKTAGDDWTQSRIQAVMQQYELLQLPLVDNTQRVVGLATLEGSLKNSRRDNPVLLMAGGFGTRLRPLTDNLPKPMLEVGDKPILERILLNFVDSGYHKFYISTHYLPEAIREHFGNGENWGVDIEYVYEEEPLGTGGALGLLPQDEIDLPLFVMNGDLLTSLNTNSFLEFHQNHDGIATICVREYEHQVPYGVITTDGTMIETMIEKPIHKSFVNAGIYLLNPELVKMVQPGTKIDMPTLLQQQIDANKSVRVFPVYESWQDIGRIGDLESAKRDAKNGQ